MNRNWRGKGELTRLGDILRAQAQKGDLPHTPGLEGAWKRAAGELVAEHVEVRSLEGKILYLGADHRQWKEECVRLEAQLMLRLRDAGFSVDRIQCELLGKA